MPRISSIEVLDKREQPTLFIRKKTTVENLPKLIADSYIKMAFYLSELGECLSEVPYVAYYSLDINDLDVEIGFPVSKTLPPNDADGINSGSIPAGKVVFCMYRGPYGEMEPVYNDMFKWAKEHNYNPSRIFYEHYYNGQDFPESEMLTMIVMPIS